MSLSQKKDLLDELHNEAAKWLAVLLDLCKNVKAPENQRNLVAWAQKWMDGAGTLTDELEDFSIRVHVAETVSEINPADNAPVMECLVDVVNAMNSITQNMYKIVNNDQNKRLFIAKSNAQRKHAKLLNEKEIVMRRLEQLKKEQLKKTMESEKKLRDLQAENIRRDFQEQARSQAMRDHEVYLAYAEAINSVNVTPHFEHFETPAEDISTPFESPNLPRKRRSRSLGRKVLGSVKKTIRRSVSAIHDYIDHHHK